MQKEKKIEIIKTFIGSQIEDKEEKLKKRLMPRTRAIVKGKLITLREVQDFVEKLEIENNE